ncbi:hypothetical protein GCM10017566_45100 [Amycolatopsis bartoniae]|uniref:Uncharacterized protein n=1 Tax=Amycolatopsis bartoniae TaxID=941986 RepID=A0A8H9IZY0_9PSEU|nr:hypothetical protein GCM10017566_45100 [Amycolatopsis bartoniae]
MHHYETPTVILDTPPSGLVILTSRFARVCNVLGLRREAVSTIPTLGVGEEDHNRIRDSAGSVPESEAEA